jgi:hypothetical protein
MKSDSLSAHQLLWLLLGVICLSIPTGCSKSQFPKTIAIQGHVTYRGKPVPAGTIGFNPTNPANRPAAGQLDSNGVYRLASFRANDGVMPGEYKITIQSFSSLPTAEDPNRPTVSRVPRRYNNIAESNLKFTVPEDANGTLEYNIDLQ